MANFGRRTWDREEYTKLSKDGQPTHEQTLKSTLTDTQLQQLKTKYTDYNGLMQSTMQDLNRKVLAKGLSSYKKGKQFGFYCELCNLTFKDSLQYIDHLNHKVHGIKFESIFDEQLINDERDNDEISFEEFEKTYTNLLNQFTNKYDTKKRKQENLPEVRRKHQRSNDQNISRSSEIQDAMGFKAFGGSKD